MKTPGRTQNTAGKLKFYLTLLAGIVYVIPAYSTNAERDKGNNSYSQTASLINKILDLENKIRQSPNNARLHLALSNLYEENGQYDKSLDEFRLAVKNGLGKRKKIYAKKESLTGYAKEKEKCLELRRNKKYDEEMSRLTSLLKRYPEFKFEIYGGIAETYSLKGDQDMALEHIKKSVNLDPSITENYFGLGEIYRKKKDFQRALLNYEKYGCFDEYYKDRYYAGIAMTRENMGQYKEAISAYKNLLNVLGNPGSKGTGLRGNTVEQKINECRQKLEERKSKRQ